MVISKYHLNLFFLKVFRHSIHVRLCLFLITDGLVFTFTVILMFGKVINLIFVKRFNINII